MSEGKFVGLVALVIVIILGLFIAVIHGQSQACDNKGGHLIYVYKSSICVSEDGRILE